MTNYKDQLEPRKFEFIKNQIDRRFHTHCPNRVEYTVVPHKITATQVDYHSSGNTIPRPSQMLDLLSGDCEDQTILLASMYMAAGLEVRMISVEKIGEDRYHLLPTVKIPEKHTHRFRDLIRECYRELFNEEIGTISTNPVGNTDYLITDPEWSDHVRDTNSLKGSYITEDTAKWYNVTDTWTVAGIRGEG